MYRLYSVIILMLIASVSFSAAQVVDPANKRDQELTQDEAIARIATFQKQVEELEAQLSGLVTDTEALEQKLSEINAALAECREALYAMIGATPDDVAAFRQQFGTLKGRVREFEGLNPKQRWEQRDEWTSMRDDLNEMRGNKIAVLPEFFQAIIDLASRIRKIQPEPQEKYYTVGTWSKDRDCLWNISARQDIYGDAFQWPRIWQANTDQIRNPDIIHPGQRLLIPAPGAKSSDEIKAERRYWRKKASEAQEDSPATGQSTDSN